MIALAILLGLGPFSAPRNASAASEPVLQAVRIGPQENATRFVAELSNRVDLSVALLADSDGIALNFRTLRFAPTLACNVHGGIVRMVQCNPASADGSQIVLRTSGPVVVSKLAVLDPRAGRTVYRVIVDLAPANQAQARGPGDVSFAASVRAAAGRQAAAKPHDPHSRQNPGFKEQAAVALDPMPPFPVRNSRFPIGRPEFAGGAVPGAMLSRPFDSPPMTAAVTAPAPPTRSAFPRPATEGRIPVVVIDPGHGGVDPGAIGLGGEQEKAITLAQALALKRELEATGRFRVLMTRNSDRFIPLGERVEIARKAGADLFVSIHADSISRAEMRGAGLYTLSDQASDAEAAALASKENGADRIAGVDLGAQSAEVSSILIDFAQHATHDRSLRLASLLMPEIGEVIPLRRNSRRSAGFRVLKAPDVASVLIELGYLSNPQDRRLLTSPASRAALAGAISRGIQAYFSPEG
jgi:N-acetylmuramoyl-L-alanine amidase